MRKLVSLCLLLCLILFFATSCQTVQIDLQTTTLQQSSTTVSTISDLFFVSRVIDGDTIVLSNGDKVRLLCINSREQGEPLYVEAGQKLSALILNKNVRLVSDKTDKDSFGRLLRYVYLEDGTFVNAEVVRSGLAFAKRYNPDIKHCPEIEQAQSEAQINHLGLWIEIVTTTTIVQQVQQQNSCVQLGCSENTVAVGSKKSDKWHYCYCRYASKISHSNLICFNSTQQAESKGYIQTKVC